MTDIIIECDVTEFYVHPEKANTKNAFCLTDRSVIISFVGKQDHVIMQSEIDKKDAIELAKFILLKYGQ